MDDEYLGRLRAFHESLPRPASPGPAAPGPVPPTFAAVQDALVVRLTAVDPDLGTSYLQVLTDVAQVRATYVGPAGELREVLRGTIAQLAPDADVIGQTWFKGHEGRPTHAERIRYALQKNHVAADGQILEADEILETMIGKLGRSLYERSSRALHAGTQQREVRKIVSWVELVLDEVLPV